MLYIESLKDYIKNTFEDGKKSILKHKIDQFESESRSDFIRVHKSFIVNTKKVKVLSTSQIAIGDIIIIPVGQRCKLVVKMFLNR